MTHKVTAKDITASVMANFRFSKGMDTLASEVGIFSCDILALDSRKGRFIEVEVKISKSDLMADFKKQKHEYYLHLHKHKEPLQLGRSWAWKNSFVPKQFFFAVPEPLLEYTLNAVEDLPYGVICYYHSNIAHHKRVRIEKRAQKLHNNDIPKNVYHTTTMRMSSELCRFHLDRVRRKCNT